MQDSLTFSYLSFQTNKVGIEALGLSVGKEMCDVCVKTLLGVSNFKY